MTGEDGLAERLRRWRVEPTGERWASRASLLAAGVRDGAPVVLKVATIEEERRGGRLLAAWAGRGAVPVLEHDADAVLMVRATGPRDLAAMSRTGDDAAATAVLVDAAAALHAVPVDAAALALLPLRRWFRDLVDAPQADPQLAAAALAAREVLGTTGPDDVVPLHGDLHHGNVLDLGDRWAAIDPKGLVGHRAFDFGNLFCNPDLGTALAHLDDRLALVSRLAGIDRRLLQRWVVAWCGLSTVWHGPASPGWHAGAARAVLQRLIS